MKKVLFTIAIFLFLTGSVYSMTSAEEKLLFQTLGEIKGELKQINRRIDDLDKKIDGLDKRIDGLDKRINETNRRIDDVNKRIDDLRKDMNVRFEQVDKRFEQVDKRFEQFDKRFEQHFKYLGWLIAGMFGMMGTFAGLLMWDRRTMINEAKRQMYREMDEEIKPEKFKRLLKALREIAAVDERVRKILEKEGLL